ncbi:MAG: hypothetical protein LDL41_18150 [Coleofasciculus sp. S288]|nr:hypothetical protein [Coleofasciculus sp. S288]
MHLRNYRSVELFIRSSNRVTWTAATVGLFIIAPSIIFGFLSLNPSTKSGLWLFSAFPWVILEYPNRLDVFLAIVGQLLMVGLLNIQLARRLQKTGESSMKALVSGCPLRLGKNGFS